MAPELMIVKVYAGNKCLQIHRDCLKDYSWWCQRIVHDEIHLDLDGQMVSEILDYLRCSLYNEVLSKYPITCNEMGLIELESDYVIINVGGEYFEVDKDMLITRSHWFENFFEWNKGRILRDLLIDRSPNAFSHILCYMKDDSYIVPQMYMVDMEYYQIIEIRPATKRLKIDHDDTYDFEMLKNFNTHQYYTRNPQITYYRIAYKRFTKSVNMLTKKMVHIVDNKFTLDLTDCVDLIYDLKLNLFYDPMVVYDVSIVKRMSVKFINKTNKSEVIYCDNDRASLFAINTLFNKNDINIDGYLQVRVDDMVETADCIYMLCINEHYDIILEGELDEGELDEGVDIHSAYVSFQQVILDTEEKAKFINAGHEQIHNMYKTLEVNIPSHSLIHSVELKDKFEYLHTQFTFVFTDPNSENPMEFEDIIDTIGLKLNGMEVITYNKYELINMLQDYFHKISPNVYVLSFNKNPADAISRVQIMSFLNVGQYDSVELEFTFRYPLEKEYKCHIISDTRHLIRYINDTIDLVNMGKRAEPYVPDILGDDEFGTDINIPNMPNIPMPNIPMVIVDPVDDTETFNPDEPMILQSTDNLGNPNPTVSFINFITDLFSS
jgi:hypothetical protein